MGFTPCTAGAWASNGNVVGGIGMAAVALQDGSVLLCGGCSSSDLSKGTAHAWLCSGGWVTSLSAPMTCIRWGHTATQLKDGRVLITGLARANDSDAQTAELYDPVAKTFTATGRMTQCRGHHSATLLRDGRVLIAGGLDNHGNPTATAEFFHPASGTFTAAPHTLLHARAHHTATPVAGGCVLIVGETSAELFTDADDSFVSTAAPSLRRLRHAAVALADGRVLVVGGYDAGWSGQPQEELWSVNNRWQQVDMVGTSSFEHSCFGPTATLLADGRVLVVGGSNNLNPFQSSPSIAGVARLFDPVTGQFSTLPGPARLQRAFHTAVALPTGQVLVAGGVSLGAALPGQTMLYCPDPAPVQLHLLFTGTGHGRVRSNPPGLDTAVADTAAFPANSTVSLVATPASPRLVAPGGMQIPGRAQPAQVVSSRCDGWSGDVTGAGTSIRVHMDSNKTVTVAFNTATGVVTPPKPRPLPGR
jgi:hypothetical protein